jgi:hypothetical protein
MRTMTHRNETAAVADGRAVRTAATIVAGVFVLVGIAGFIPGLTTNLDDIEFAGHAHTEQTELLGIFHVSVLHNLVHLAFGVGLFMARSAAGAVTFLIGGGIVYALVLVYGVAIDLDSDWNFIPVDEADNWLHGGLAVGMIALGVALSPRSRRGTDQVG